MCRTFTDFLLKRRLSLLSQWKRKAVQTTGRCELGKEAAGCTKCWEIVDSTPRSLVSQSVCLSVCLFISSKCLVDASYFGACGTATADVRQNTTLLRRRNNTTQHDATQHNTTQHNATQCNTTTQHNTTHIHRIFNFHLTKGLWQHDILLSVQPRFQTPLRSLAALCRGSKPYTLKTNPSTAPVCSSH